MNKVNKETFESEFCNKSGITPEEYAEHFVTLPCKCDYAKCKGWAAVGNSELEIKIHNELHNQ